MLAHIPLMIIPFIAYNAIALTSASGNPWVGEVATFSLISTGVWIMTLGDVMLLVALFFLFVEIIKSTRTSNASVVDHLLSTLVFVAFLVEFLVVPAAATSVFFLMTVMAAVDLMAGFSVSIRSAGRDVSIG
ncbi:MULTISPECIES: hypothetical protein [unclassified Roseitalea]|uniref:hypothetical protein n=1 Tax=unclassified Roseitalea TaxID=2639107 RepID=UPI00273DFDDE|nr:MULTISPECIES: hypothetical protein [unclassified Roseitalea]